MSAVRTLERGYYSGSPRRAGQVRRVHVIREEGPRGWDGETRQTWCGQVSGEHRHSAPIVREAPHPLPEGLAWCPKCIGLLAGQLGLLGEVARLLGVETTLDDRLTGREDRTRGAIAEDAARFAAEAAELDDLEPREAPAPAPDTRLAVDPDGHLKPASEFTEKWWCDCEDMDVPHIHTPWGSPHTRAVDLTTGEYVSPLPSARRGNC